MTMNLFKKTDFEVIDNRYFFHILYFAARLFFKFKKDRKIKVSAINGFMKIIHKFISFFFIIEYYLFPKKMKGSSIICIAERNGYFCGKSDLIEK